MYSSVASVAEEVVKPELVQLSQGQFSSDAAGRVVSRKARLLGNVTFGERLYLGKQATIRGDLVKMQFGSYVYLGDDVVIRPPVAKIEKEAEVPVVNFSDLIYVGDRVISEAINVSSFVIIGADSVIGFRCNIGTCVIIMPKTVIPPHVELAAYGIYAGNPAQRVGELDIETADSVIRDAITKKILGFVVCLP
jgi:carbonic anhydrase/acetyltransferase-like protein (isoleucine patch superfamily)